MTASMTREAALRLGMAARELGDVDVRAFVHAVGGKLGLPLTETRLAGLTVDDLREILAGNHADEDCKVGVEPEKLKRIVRLLWGEGMEYSELPVVEPSAGRRPGSILAACASNTGEVLDGHFGSCERFLVYELTPQASHLFAIRPTLEADHEEDRNAARAALIADCDVLFVQSIGGPAAAKVVRAGVHPVKVPRPESARAVIARLQSILPAPPPWLARVMGVPAVSLQKYQSSLEEAA